MTRENTDTCASCSKFPLHEAAENKGRAMCKDFEVDHVFNDRACVLHMRASGLEERKRIVIHLINQQKAKNDPPAPE